MRGHVGAGEAGQGLDEAAILCDQQVVVVVLQVEGDEGELDACRDKAKSVRASDSTIRVKPPTGP